MSKSKEKQGERETIAIANYCRTFLYMNGFLTQSQMESVHNKIIKYRDKKKVLIKPEQVMSVYVMYNDNPEIK